VRHSVAVASNELRILRRDPSWIILVLGVPLVLVGLLRNGVHAILVLSGHPGVSGADFSVPAQAVTFVFYLPALIGLSFLREHTWGTWDRLRTSTATTTGIVVGKLIPVVSLGMLQMAVVFGLGGAAFGLTVRGSVAGVVLVVAALLIAVVAMGTAITSLVHTAQQLNAVGNIAPVGLGAIGGALMPLSTLPGWVHHIAPATPQYWAMRGFDAMILSGQGIASAVLPAVMLLCFAAGFGLVALAGLRRTASRLSYG